MARPGKFASPTLALAITAEHYETAKQSASGACLIADAIKRQYPQYTGVAVDMATVRVTDKAKGVRYTYLTPEPAQMLLLSFDQGWPQSTEAVSIKRAVKISPIVKAGTRAAEKAARMAELEAKEAAGTLVGREKAALTTMRKTPARATSHGRAEMGKESNRVVHGGRPIPKATTKHPNLLASRDRHYGAKLAKAGTAFDNAVAEAAEAAVAERIARGELVAGKSA